MEKHELQSMPGMCVNEAESQDISKTNNQRGDDHTFSEPGKIKVLLVEDNPVNLKVNILCLPMR